MVLALCVEQKNHRTRNGLENPPAALQDDVDDFEKKIVCNPFFHLELRRHYGFDCPVVVNAVECELHVLANL